MDVHTDTDNESPEPSRREDRPKKSRQKRPYIGHHVLKEYQSDWHATDLPSWITPGPLNLGKKGNGKLSADAWRVVSTIHMVITLMRLWGWSSETSGDFLRLSNYMQLVTAVTSATRRVTTQHRRKILQTAIVSYLRDIQVLYATKIEANQHMATHLVQFLRYFGPPHSWWSFFFERDNGILQKIPTNYIFGIYLTPRCFLV
jgi:hypothetical protein